MFWRPLTSPIDWILIEMTAKWYERLPWLPCYCYEQNGGTVSSLYTYLAPSLFSTLSSKCASFKHNIQCLELTIWIGTLAQYYGVKKNKPTLLYHVEKPGSHLSPLYIPCMFGMIWYPPKCLCYLAKKYFFKIFLLKFCIK